MTLGEKVRQLRVLEGMARGLGRELTQTEVSQAITELGGKISQSYLSQIEKGSRPHLTHTTRSLLARFFHVHPGHLVDDPEQKVELSARKRSSIDEQLDHWLIDGGETFQEDAELSLALNEIARHENSRRCLLLLAGIVRNRGMLDRLFETMTPIVAVRRRRATPP